MLAIVIEKFSNQLVLGGPHGPASHAQCALSELTRECPHTDTVPLQIPGPTRASRDMRGGSDTRR